MKKLRTLFAPFIAILCLAGSPQAFPQELVDIIDTRDLGSDKPLGITYDPTRGGFAFADGTRDEIFVIKLTEGETGGLQVEKLAQLRLNEDDLFIPAGIAFVPAAGPGKRFAQDTSENLFAIVQTNRMALTASDLPADPFLGIFFFGLQGGFSIQRFAASLYGSTGPGGIAYDANRSSFLVTDFDRNEIIRISRDGTSMGSIPLSGGGEFDSDQPAGIDVEPDSGSIMFIDLEDRQVYVIDPLGNLVTQFSTAQFGILSPLGIAIDPVTRYIAISDFESEKIYIIRQGSDAEVEMIAPVEGVRIFGSAVTLAARLTSGTPSRVDRIDGVLFQVRPVGGTFESVVPVAPGVNPNPDTQPPFLVHVDMTDPVTFPPGDYEAQAVVRDRINGNTSTSAPVQFTVVDSRDDADVVEELEDGLHTQIISLTDGVLNRIETGNSGNQDSSISIEIPPGIPLGPNANLKVTYPDPTEIVFTDPVTMEQFSLFDLTNNIVIDIGAYLTFELFDADSEFSEDNPPRLIWSYKDENQDGIVDGTNIREIDLKICVLDESVPPQWKSVFKTQVDPVNNLLIGEVTSFSEFGVLGIAPGRIFGKVISPAQGNEGVAEADVDIEGGFNLGIDTDDEGNFVFTQVVVGDYSASSFKRGFTVPRAQSLAVGPASDQEINFQMDPSDSGPVGACPTAALIGDSKPSLLGALRNLRDGLASRNRFGSRLNGVYYSH